MAATLVKPGDLVAEDHGLLRLTRYMSICGGITIRVFAGPTELQALAHHFPRGRFRAARIWWAEIAAMADTRLAEHLIVARMQALVAAAEAATAEAIA